MGRPSIWTTTSFVLFDFSPDSETVTWESACHVKVDSSHGVAEIFSAWHKMQEKDGRSFRELHKLGGPPDPVIVVLQEYKRTLV